MHILLLGRNGQLGWELQRSLAPLGRVTALDRASTDFPGDLAQPQALADSVRRLRPDVIVNAAAYTAVDRAESEPELARAVNALAPEVLAQQAQQLGALLVHYSTDYVFDGSGVSPWTERDATAPLNVYGTTKLEAEQRIAATGCRHLIFRTSWVYAARGGNFAKTMLRLARERERLSVIDDQYGAPTGAELLADVSAHAICQTLQDASKAGLYHLAAAGETTWNRYARFVLAQARQAGQELKASEQAVDAVASSAFVTAARRPLNSRLDCRKLEQRFRLTLPPWQAGVARMLTEIL